MVEKAKKQGGEKTRETSGNTEVVGYVDVYVTTIPTSVAK